MVRVFENTADTDQIDGVDTRDAVGDIVRPMHPAMHPAMHPGDETGVRHGDVLAGAMPAAELAPIAVPAAVLAPGARAKRSVPRAATTRREAATALVKYATNHIIARIPSYTVRHAWYRRVLGWQIAPGASVLMGQRIITGGLRRCRNMVSIGDDSVVNRGCLWTPYVPIRIGAHVSISSGVSLITGGHDINHPEFAGYAHPIIIEDYAWICMNATILGGVTIGRGAVVCTGAVVTKDVPAFAIVAGVPARVVGKRKLTDPAYSLNFRPLFE